MLWLIAGILSPFFWAMANNIDQYMVREHFVNKTKIYRAMLMTTRIFIIPLVFIIDGVLEIDPLIIILLMLIGMNGFLAFAAYNKALQYDEASKAVPFLQTIPIFMFIILYFTNNETVTITQLIGSFIIIISALALLIDKNSKTINTMVVWFMLLSAALFSFGNVIQRILLTDNIPWYVVFLWVQVGSTFMGVYIFSTSSEARTRFKKMFVNKEKNLFFGIILQQLSMNLAYLSYVLALKNAPSGGLAQSLSGFQPIFILLIGLIFAKLFPEHFRPPKTKHDWVWYFIFTLILLIGVAMIYGVTP